MKTKSSNQTLLVDQRSYLWLAIGFVFLLFANGTWAIPSAIWISLVFLLRFVRTQKPLRGYLISGLVFSITYYFTWNAAFKPIVPYFPALAILSGFLGALLFFTDRLIYHHFQGVFSTLPFPIIWTTFVFLNSFGEATTWCSIAYTQYGNLPLMQLVSVTGIYGIVFLITWFVAVVNFLWEQDFNWLKIRNTIALYACVFVAVLFLGGMRVNFFPPKSKTVRIASITVPDRLPAYTEYKKSKRLPIFNDLLKELTDSSQKATQMGAKIIFWQEFAFLLATEKENAFIQQASSMAKENEVYMLLSLVVLGPEHGVNKTVLLSPSGETVFDYKKQRPVMGIETPYIVAGQKKPPVAKTPYGRISSVICADLDSPNLIREVGKENIDILLAPALDWKELDPLHTRMSVFRSIENGFSIIRSNGGGLSLAVDYQGTSISGMNVHTTDEKIMISDIPIKGVPTIYSKIGDLFAWICFVGFITMVGRLIWLKKQK